MNLNHFITQKCLDSVRLQFPFFNMQNSKHKYVYELVKTSKGLVEAAQSYVSFTDSRA